MWFRDSKINDSVKEYSLSINMIKTIPCSYRCILSSKQLRNIPLGLEHQRNQLSQTGTVENKVSFSHVILVLDSVAKHHEPSK